MGVVSAVGKVSAVGMVSAVIMVNVVGLVGILTIVSVVKCTCMGVVVVYTKCIVRCKVDCMQLDHPVFILLLVARSRQALPLPVYFLSLQVM